MTWREDWAGTDEVGRGALAGPVVGAAVVWRDGRAPAIASELADSKRLSPRRRRELACALIADDAVAIALAWAMPDEIDATNILQASLRAMGRAVQALACRGVYVDGNQRLPIGLAQEVVVQGDGKVPQIAAASIVAKVFRDHWMISLDAQYPVYGWAGNKGYGAPDHLRAIEQVGPCEFHRRSFAPVRQMVLFPT